MNEHYTQKTIALLLGVSVRTVQRNEKSWGIHTARWEVSGRARYNPKKVIDALKARNMLDSSR